MTAASVRGFVAVLALVAAPLFAQSWGLAVRDPRSPPGVEIVSIAAATPAERAGLREGDIILRLDGIPVRNAAEFERKMALHSAGTIVAFSASRQGWERELRIDLAGFDVGHGITVADMSVGSGPRVLRVEPGSAAEVAGVEPGDVITGLDGRRPVTVLELQASRGSDGRRMGLTLARGQRAVEVTLSVRESRASSAAAIPTVPNGTAAPSGALAGSVVDEIVEANRLYEASQWADAELRYARVIAAVRDVPQAWGRLCHVQVMQGRFAEALATCREAMQWLPRETGVYQNAGYSLSRMGRHAEAIGEFQKVLALSPERVDPYRSIAGSYFALRNWAKAEEYSGEVVKREPTSQAAWHSLGDAQGELGKSADAVTSYRKALDLGPGSAALYRALGWHLYRAERFAEAEPVLAEANRLNPRDANTLVTLGSVKFKLGKPTEARNAWQRAVDLEPTTPIGAIARQSLASVGGEAQRAPDAAPRPETPGSAASKSIAPAHGRDLPRDASEPDIDVGN